MNDTINLALDLVLWLMHSGLDILIFGIYINMDTYTLEEYENLQ